MRTELDWFFTLKTVGDPCRMVVTLKPTAVSGEMETRVSLDVTIKNVTNAKYTGSNPPEFHADEWRSQTGPTTVSPLLVDHVAIPSRLERHRYGVIRRGEKPVTIPAGASVHYHFEKTEYKRDRDELTEILRVAVVDPAVVVICPDGVTATVDFGHRESRMTDDGQTFSMSGTLLPWQPLRVRWWRSSDPDTGQVEE
jgi:hypothetical protein